jgi:hypothetical protein
MVLFHFGTCFWIDVLPYNCIGLFQSLLLAAEEIGGVVWTYSNSRWWSILIVSHANSIFEFGSLTSFWYIHRIVIHNSVLAYWSIALFFTWDETCIQWCLNFLYIFINWLVRLYIYLKYLLRRISFTTVFWALFSELYRVFKRVRWLTMLHCLHLFLFV